MAKRNVVIQTDWRLDPDNYNPDADGYFDDGAIVDPSSVMDEPQHQMPYVGFKCAHCGNDNPRWLWNEGDTVLCQKCSWRTKFDGTPDEVVCPHCGKLTRRKSIVCFWCNDSI